jgi:hypothetical protein
VSFAGVGPPPLPAAGRCATNPLGPGDLCAVELREGDYRVVKILAMGDGMVNVWLYADKFVDRPFEVNPAQLDGKSFVTGRLSVSAEDFATWRPRVVGHEEVRSEELAWERSLLRSRT